MNLLKNILKTFHGLWTMVHGLSSHGPSSMVHRLSSYGLWSMVYGLILFSSCTTEKNLVYLKGVEEEGPDNFYPGKVPEYRIQKQDILYIKIMTDNQEINGVLNQGSTQGNQSVIFSDAGAYLSGYSVNDSGCITLPLIGNIKVLGKTVEEIQKVVNGETGKHLKDAIVNVKLMTYKFSVIGEINSPGTYHNYSNQLTILDAIGMAGDMTDYSDRSSVLVIRSINDGSHSFTVDLHNKDLLLSENYYVLPNDIIIVRAINRKYLSLNAPTLSFFINTIVSSISLTLLILKII